MDFHFDPTVSKHTSLVVTTFQTAGTLLIALLLRLLTRGIPGRFLFYWSLAWVALAAGLLSLNLASLITPFVSEQFASRIQGPALAAYTVFQYAFGFYLWAGCRAYAKGTTLTGPDWWLFAAPAAFGLVAAIFFSSIDTLFPFHAGVLGGFCLLALLATMGTRPEARQTVVGLRLMQTALAGITLLFWHYAMVMGWILTQHPRPDFEYLHFSALYDALIEMLLGFGMVVLGTDSVRRELETKNTELAESNRKLAEASERLAVAARTDPLTGLLNRRALDAMLAERAGLPFVGSVAVIDLNDLKQLNDMNGHAAGDAAIQLVARALRMQFRITDPIFRTGGDEFLVILENGRSSDIVGRLEGVDLALRGLRLPGVPTPMDVVVAWGMADFESFGELPEALARADAAMYGCKMSRKARSRHAGPTSLSVGPADLSAGPTSLPAGSSGGRLSAEGRQTAEQT
jgi:diguanylate cyclase (GGDEF)-like protein